MIERVKRREVAQSVPCLLLHVHSGADLLEVAHNLNNVVNNNHQTDDGLQYDLKGYRES